MTRLAMIALLPLILAAPAAAANMDQMAMPGMVMPMPAAKAPSPHAARATHGRKPVQAKTARRAHRRAKPETAVTPGMPMNRPRPAGEHAMSNMAPPQSAGARSQDASGDAGMRMSGSASSGAADMPSMEDMGLPGRGQGQSAASAEGAAGTVEGEPVIPQTPPPPPPVDHAADRYYDPAAMAAARAILRQEHGGGGASKVIANLAEYQSRASGGGYRWDGQAWFGGDINRFVAKSEGEGSRLDGVDAAEVQGLYSHAVGPYFDVQVGVRQDVRPRARTYASVGVEGVAAYWFDVGAAVFISSKGELLGRLEGTYDLRLTQRLILQPRAELNFAAQDTLETRTGSGLSNAELGLRLRYEIRREFAPYIGVSFDRKLGRTADFARLRGEGAGGATFVAGIRAWF
jgi:copper resistance protein B